MDDHQLWDAERFWENCTWQNNIIRLALAVSVAGSIAVLVYFIYAISYSTVENAGSVATPLLIICMMIVLISIGCILIEREKIKNRLPACTVLRVGLAAFGTLMVFGLKSFTFLFCMYTAMLFGIFLFREFDNRLRAAAVCGIVYCLVVAEALRRPGGYDSGGLSRFYLNLYSFLAFFSPAFVVLTTMQHLPRLTKACLVGYVILTLLSGNTLVAGMARVLDNTIAGNGNGVQSGYCLEDNWHSPLGAMIAAFKDAIKPEFKSVNTTTTTFRYVPTALTIVTTSTTTTSDPCIYMEVPVIPDINETDDSNETNRTRIERICPFTLEVNIADPNSTTTTSTTTTTTTTTSTTLTTTTSTSTTSTSTSSTSSTTSTTILTTTSSTSTTITTSNNDTTTVSSTIALFASIPREACWLTLPGKYLAGYTAYGEYCHDMDTATALCLRLKDCNGITRSAGLCGDGSNFTLRAGKMGRSAIGFDAATLESRVIDPECTANVPPPRCVPGTPETEVSSAGIWAIVVYSLAGLWISSLVHVVFKVGIEIRAARASMRVKPQPPPSEQVEELPASPKGLLAIADGSPTNTNLRSSVGSKTRSSGLPALTDWSPKSTKESSHGPRHSGRAVSPIGRPSGLRVSRSSSATHISMWSIVSDGKPKKCRRCRRCCRRCLRVIFKSTELLLVIAVYVVLAGGLIIAGVTQLPKDKPECAAEPASFFDPKAWVEAPVDRMQAVWCDIGALAGAGLGFLGYCNYVFVSAMLLNKVVKQDSDARALAQAQQEKELRDLHNHRRSASRQSVASRPPSEKQITEEKVKVDHHYHASDHIKKEMKPEPVYEDYDGRLFDI